MQSVGDRWYIRYNLGASAVAVVLLLAAAALWIAPPLAQFQHKWGVLSIITASIAGLQLAYSLLLYKRAVAQTDYYQATAVVSFVQALNILNLVHATGQLHSWFLIPWALVIMASGIFGVVGLMCCVFLTGLLYVFSVSDVIGTSATANDPVTFATLGGIAVVSILSYVFWRRLYTHEETAIVAQLSGKLKTNLQQSEILIQSLTDGTLLMNTEGQISLMNPAAAVMTGWSVVDGIGSDCRIVVTLKNEDASDLAPNENPLNNIFETSTATTKTLQLTSRDGKQTIISIVTSPVLDPKTQILTGAVAVLRDISVSYQSEKQRAEFISTASHEMRTPVAAIEGYLQLTLNEKVSKVDTKARGYLEKALESTHHLGALFQDLLTSAKAEDGRLSSHPSVIEMGAYVEALAETFKFSADKKGLLTDFIFGSSGSGSGSTAGDHIIRPLYYVQVDPDRLREVVTNLFDNAVKYTPAGKISVGLTGNANVVQMFVRDTGPGIPPEDVPHLFQKFYRVDNSATRTIGGTGLGLFISRKIIELYLGRIWVESTVGKGSTFYINLPRLDSQRAEQLKIAEAQSASSAPITSLTTPV